VRSPEHRLGHNDTYFLCLKYWHDICFYFVDSLFPKDSKQEISEVVLNGIG